MITSTGSQPSCERREDSAETLPPSIYAAQMPILRQYAALPTTDPQRAELRERLILGFLPVVKNVARHYAAGNASFIEDLTQAGVVALINAIDRWDPELARGEFLGYLIPCVRGHMLHWFRDRTWSTRVPRQIKDLTVAIERARGPMAHDLGRAPRPTELAVHLGVEREDVIEAINAKANQYAAPLDRTDGTGRSPVDNLGSVDLELDHVESRHVVSPLLDDLPERERTIVVLRFYEGLTQAQIAEQVGVSQMHISRLLRRTLDGMRLRLAEDT